MMSDSSRVYNKVVDLDGDGIRDFFDKRALDYACKSRSRNTTVLLGDSNAGYAERWDSFEKEFVLSKLDVKRTDSVIDIGCGIGRWAESLIPLCGSYMGVDLSEQMVKIAAAAYKGSGNCQFIDLSFQNIFEDDRVSSKKYQVVIITGVSMYLNDADLGECYRGLCDLLAPGGILYMEESVGMRNRLSLNRIWSESLNDYYYAIYRTVDEYMQLLKPLTEICSIVQDGYLRELDKEELMETGHWFILLRRDSD